MNIRRRIAEHRGITLILILFVALASWYSVITPIFETPDEREHFAFVQFVARGNGLPAQSVDASASFKQEGSQPPLYYLLAAALTFWIDTSDFPAMAWENPHYGYNVPGIVNDNKNLFIHTARENFPYTGAVLAIHLARFLSVLIGASAVLFTYLLALEVFECFSRGDSHVAVARRSHAPTLAACAAAVAAFVPQFLFISGAVSNDSAIVALCALALWQMARLLNDHRLPTADRDVLTLGLICGLAALAKVSGLMLAVLALGVLVWRGLPQFSIEPKSKIENRKSKILFHFTLFAFAFLLVAGWWYARNLLLYGELTGTEMMLSIFGGRTTPMTLDLFTAQTREVFETFWVGFGWGNIRAPEWVYGVVAVAGVVGGVGLIRFMIYDLGFRIWNAQPLVTTNHKSETLAPHASAGVINLKSKILLLLFWLLLVLAALIRWMLVTQAPHGRLFFPALPALAVLIVFGWMQILPDRLGWKAAVLPPNALLRLAQDGWATTPQNQIGGVLGASNHVSIFAFFAFALFANLTILAPAYAYPAWLNENDLAAIPNRVEITYGDQMKLLGYDIVPRRAAPNGSLEVTLYWQSLAAMDDDYSIGLNLLDANQRVLSSRVSYPGRGLLPTRLWRAGQMLRDTYWMPVPADVAAPSLAQLQVTLYSRATRRDLPARDAAGQAITPFVGRVRIVPPQTASIKPQHETRFVFNDQTLAPHPFGSAGVALVGYDAKGNALTLYWQARAPVPNDYTVFVHLFDADDKIIAQIDRQPQNGNAPTSLWEKGEVVVDTYTFDLPAARAARVGLYRAESGERAEVRDQRGERMGYVVTLDLSEASK